MPNGTNSNVALAATTRMGPVGNSGASAMLTAATVASRGVLGIVPGSLLPIDVSFVFRGSYWIWIIYRKYIAVDMRCFAGDQVWLHLATPPKSGPIVGGSLPCPQFPLKVDGSRLTLKVDGSLLTS
ncbi:putative mediator complex, subunit Med14 [Helianthus annuus]|nr:putative mediator complex, subunit Med14 [Helianthus annuus]